ncbi:MAG: cytochrome c class I [Cyclobacteriaceae bacterium]|jgi:cytochrome c|nr:cytochrome c class I [Cyclobacteriaceae bacterium]
MKTLKSICLIVVLTIGLAACGSKKEATTPAEDYGTPDESGQKIASVDAITQGESLVNASDCKTCHHRNDKLIGPAHMDVAKKYDFTAANVTLLADKIINGGSGVWGEVPMSPHPDITKENAEKMAKYVLSLDGEKEH